MQLVGRPGLAQPRDDRVEVPVLATQFVQFAKERITVSQHCHRLAQLSACLHGAASLSPPAPIPVAFLSECELQFAVTAARRARLGAPVPALIQHEERT